MAIDRNQTQQPEVTVVSSYSIYRMDESPWTECVLQEAIRVREDAVVVDDALDDDTDGVFEKLVVSAWSGREDLPGHEVDDSDGNFLGKIVSWDDGTNTATLKDATSDSDLSGEDVRLVSMSKFGSPYHKPVQGYNPTRRRLRSSNPTHLAYMGNLLGQSYVEAVLRVLAALGDTNYTQQDVANAVQQLANDGWNLDSALAKGFEQVELDFRDGVLP